MFRGPPDAVGPRYDIEIRVRSADGELLIPPSLTRAIAMGDLVSMPNSGAYRVASSGTLSITVTVMPAERYAPGAALATASVELPLRPFWLWIVQIAVATSNAVRAPGSFMSPVARAVPVRGADSLFVMVGGESRGLPFHLH